MRIVLLLIVAIITVAWVDTTPGPNGRDTYVVVAADDGSPSNDEFDATRDILLGRLFRLGADDATLVATPDGRLVISVSAELDPAVAMRTLRQVGDLRLVPVPTDERDRFHPGASVTEALADIVPILANDGVASAAAIVVDGVPGSVLDIRLADAAARRFDSYARDHVGEPVAFVLDGIILSVPVIDATSYDGRARISAGFDEVEAAALAVILADGRTLPFRVVVEMVS